MSVSDEQREAWREVCTDDAVPDYKSVVIAKGDLLAVLDDLDAAEVALRRANELTVDLLESARAESARWKERWRATVAERDDLLTVLSDHPGHRVGCEWCENNDAALSRIDVLVKEWSGWAHDDTLLAQTVVRSLRRALGGVA